MPAVPSLRDRYLSLCDGIQSLTREFDEERKGGFAKFAATLGPGNHPFECQVYVKERLLAGAGIHEFSHLLAYSPKVQFALSRVRELLKHGSSSDPATWPERILNAQRQLHTAVIEISPNLIEHVEREGNPLVEALAGIDDGNIGLESQVIRCAEESRDFHSLAFELLGKGKVLPLPTGADGYERDRYLTEADFAKLRILVSASLPSVTAAEWKDASTVERVELLRAAKSKAAQATEVIQNNPALSVGAVPSGADRIENETPPVNRPGPKLKPPSADAMAAYRLSMLRGKTQVAIAAELALEWGRPVNQGNVSRWINQSEAWINAGNVLPGMDGKAEKPVTIDPAQLELGKRQDSLTKRQRYKKTEE